MSDVLSTIKKYEPLWGVWKIDSFLGRGSYGKVYKIVKEDMSGKYESALKYITIPRSEEELKAVKNMNLDSEGQYAYFQSMVQGILNEIKIMYKLRGNKNVINYEDHLIYEYKNEMYWDILIKMEYLEPLNSYKFNHKITEKEIIKIGIDISNALVSCEAFDIIHRDIKDSNIFVDENGTFKLGDFGISKELSKTGIANTLIGTPLYCAPEMLKGEAYDKTVDIYSLGLLLYKLLNNGRMPFMPEGKKDISPLDNDESLRKRLYGVKPPPPTNCDETLGNIILKAIEYEPRDRCTPKEMKDALTSLFNKKYPAEASENKNNDTQKTMILTPEEKKEIKKKRRKDKHDKKVKEKNPSNKGKLKFAIITLLIVSFITLGVLFFLIKPEYAQKIINFINSKRDNTNIENIVPDDSSSETINETWYENFTNIDDSMDYEAVKKRLEKNFPSVAPSNPNTYVFSNAEINKSITVSFDGDGKLVNKQISPTKADFPENIRTVTDQTINLYPGQTTLQDLEAKYGPNKLLIQKSYKDTSGFRVMETYAYPLVEEKYLDAKFSADNVLITYSVEDIVN